MNKKSMKVKEMADMLGLKKTDSYYLLHKGWFEVVTIQGKMRIMVDSFEKWYNSQSAYKKVNGPPPANIEYYTLKDISEITGKSVGRIWERVNKGQIPAVHTQKGYRVKKEDFEKWYAEYKETWMYQYYG